MNLSILIPSTPNRRDVANKLAEQMIKYCGGDWSQSERKIWWNDVDVHLIRKYEKQKGVEIYIVEDDKKLILGEKRELIYKHLAWGQYSVQWDSDDEMHPDFFDEVLRAIKAEPDCVTYEEYCLMDGRVARSKHSLKYDKWEDNIDGYDYVRCPFYKDVIKTEIAKKVPFPKIRYNEDEQWSMAIRPLLEREVHIPKQLYRYIYNSTPNETDRYGHD